MHAPDERMSGETGQVERIQRLVELACVARGWSRQALAAHLGRDVSRLVPEGGNPKLDYVMKLADALAWPVGDVARAIRGSGTQARTDSSSASTGGFEKARRLGAECFARGDYSGAIEQFRQMYRSADSAEQRARSLANESAAWSGLGRYAESIEAASRALAEGGIDTHRRLQIYVNMAQSLLYLAQFDLCLALADMVVRTCEEPVPERTRESWLAPGLYVRGFAHLRLASKLSASDECARVYLSRARSDFESAIRYLEESASSHAAPTDLSGLRPTCQAGLIEAKTLLGVMPAADAIEALDAEIERVERRGGNYLWVESVAWLSIAGAMISLRHLDGRALQHRLAVYTHKALEFGDKLSNWAIKERVTTLEFLGRRAVGEKAGIDIDIVLDRDDRARIADLMARFPNFREDGWRLLETARFVN